MPTRLKEKSCNCASLLKKSDFRGVAQPGLEYASGGRVVASSNLVTPTEINGSKTRFSIRFFVHI